jgi:hypothetical protein
VWRGLYPLFTVMVIYDATYSKQIRSTWYAVYNSVQARFAKLWLPEFERYRAGSVFNQSSAAPAFGESRCVALTEISLFSGLAGNRANHVAANSCVRSMLPATHMTGTRVLRCPPWPAATIYFASATLWATWGLRLVPSGAPAGANAITPARSGCVVA